MNAIEMKIATLSTMPERCPLAEESGRWGTEEIHSLLFDDYPSKHRIIFTISDQTVRILNIRNGSRVGFMKTRQSPGKLVEIGPQVVDYLFNCQSSLLIEGLLSESETESTSFFVPTF